MSRWPELTTEERFWAKVEKTDSCWNWTASKNNFGYGRFKQNGEQKYAHRISYEMAVGAIPPGMVIDHKCHNPSCVRPEHLRACTTKENQENRSGAQARNCAGVRGVYWHELAGKWMARVGHNGREHYVGLFTDLAEAQAAVTAKRLELFTHNDIDRRAA